MLWPGGNRWCGSVVVKGMGDGEAFMRAAETYCRHDGIDSGMMAVCPDLHVLFVQGAPPAPPDATG